MVTHSPHKFRFTRSTQLQCHWQLIASQIIHTIKFTLFFFSCKAQSLVCTTHQDRTQLFPREDRGQRSQPMYLEQLVDSCLCSAGPMAALSRRGGISSLWYNPWPFSTSSISLSFPFSGEEQEIAIFIETLWMQAFKAFQHPPTQMTKNRFQFSFRYSV